MDLSRITNRRTDLTCLACEQSEPSCANVVSALFVARLRCVSYVEDVVALVLRLFCPEGPHLCQCRHETPPTCTLTTAIQSCVHEG